MNWIALPVVAVAAALVALGLWSRRDARAVDAAWQRLIRTAPRDPARFVPSMIADLPEPARRFLSAAIRPGTPLATVAEVSMHGELSLGTKARPAYWPMRACQILAAPHGFVWQVATGEAPLRVRGSDGALPDDSWTRFWMAGVIPVARVGGTANHARSSFARFVSEASFWTPAVMMPSDCVHWEAVDANTARVTLTNGNRTQAIELTLDAEGHPVHVVFER